jgi:hypothetical protein
VEEQEIRRLAMAKQIKIKHLNDGQGIIKINNDTYKLSEIKAGTEVYEEIDKSEYDNELHNLAASIAKVSNIDIISVIESALKQYDYEYIKKLKETLESEVAKAEQEERQPKIKTRKGCYGISIGSRRNVGSFLQIVQ